jgi:F-type H+-transporting ATPase subunit b
MFLDPKFWLAVSFFIFLFLAIRYVMPKIMGLLNFKTKQIAEEIDQAKHLKQRAEQLLLEAKSYHQESLLYCQNLVIDAKQEAEKFLMNSKNNLATEISRKTTLAKEQIKQEEERMIREIKFDIISAATKAIEEKSYNLSNQSALEINQLATANINKMIN